MRKFRFAVNAPATLWIAIFLLPLAADGRTIQEESTAIIYFDVLELPARIDEPKLVKSGDRYLVSCAVANRSDEQLLGLRLIVMIVDREGKLRARAIWNEESKVTASSIRPFEFIAPIKEKMQSSDHLFLALDEVIGQETIWRAIDAEKTLRAYSRGEHDVVPKVRAVANKDDRELGPRVIPPKLKRNP